MAKVEKNNKKKEVPVFDPSKQYIWKPEDEFVIDGKQLQQLYNTLLGKAQDPAWVQVVNEYESLKIMHELFARGVEQGIIVEKEETETQTGEKQ